MNILVVEDEPLALDDLLGMLQAFDGVHQIAGCSSGVEALEYAATTPPDLVITDVRMPEIDGLELVRQLKARIPQLAAIVLSGYSEFEYARAGLRLGIADYLLKPVRTEALHQAVARAFESITASRTHATHVREAELARLLLGGQRASRPEPNLLAGDWGVVVLICENWEAPTIWRDTPIDREFMARALAGELPYGYDVVDVDARCRLALVRLAGPQQHVLDAIAQRRHRAIAAAGVVAHTTYVLKAAGDRPERALSEGLDRLARAMHFAAPTFTRPAAESEDAAGGLAREYTQLVARFLAEGRVADAVSEVYAALGRFQRDGATQATIVQALDTMFALVQQHAKARLAGPLPDRKAIDAVIRSLRTYDELVAWVDTQLQPLLLSRSAATPRQLVRALVAQVQANYAEDISLQAFATEHNVSLAYFSRLFKDEVGMTFSDFLTRVRVEKAKELLERRDLRLSDISGLVGYDDPKYFAQTFRKVAGISALDYQRSRPRDGQHGDSVANGQE
jgi:DNA-binding NarL/FixJ family response regulator/AraC-like DNA-binding protein